MEKKDLKVGMVIEQRNGIKSIIIGNDTDRMYYSFEMCGCFSDINDDLTHKTKECYDIVKVFEISNLPTDDIYGMFNHILHISNLKLLWERPDGHSNINKKQTKAMQKSDLKIGMSVRHRNGESSIILGKEDFKVMYSIERHITLYHIKDDLTHKANDDLDIVEIFEHPNECFYNLYEAMNVMQLDGYWKSVWKRDNN